ncbi:2-amino-4-hydroxy-6-hydroxymethyldihydropteridine diphosphokinase [Glacieibacterium frigidum]|uniref:2-amino-4-hydroxy-6-hydroxymethyldihydropteridine pyrophosphokinase n=1 Tax=Glacieibacterium frigidum TaxID=2593303 RepID=A0A552U7F1_9SPHN|nr:2-amino-4-hydroxy-6-hydroxymethyldihydropteridine diphosphokinase [Glacieibacterium frigidum]TRW14141.1 2-amino-4-hydroxy-6-hydroxymethyldihydropteridine diphosphokinase [Glacieibacterium frigidum]
MAANTLIALGSNRRHGRHGSPAGVVAAAVAALDAAGLRVVRRSRTHSTAAVGPGGRRFANAVVAVATDLGPAQVLDVLNGIEAAFGRRGARRWGARVLDLDLLAQGPAVLKTRRLTLPHPRLHQRAFVLDPLVEVAPRWRHPLLGATARQLHARLHRPKAASPSP